MNECSWKEWFLFSRNFSWTWGNISDFILSPFEECWRQTYLHIPWVKSWLYTVQFLQNRRCDMCKSVCFHFSRVKKYQDWKLHHSSSVWNNYEEGFFFDNGYQISCMLYMYIYILCSICQGTISTRENIQLIAFFFSAIWVSKRKGMQEMYYVTGPRWFNTFACSPVHSLHDAFTIIHLLLWSFTCLVPYIEWVIPSWCLHKGLRTKCQVSSGFCIGTGR